MPRTTFDPANKIRSDFDYPKLMLEKGERARVLVIETEPLFEWVHVLRMPRIMNGRVMMETVMNFNKQVEQPVMDFVGRHICIGDYGVIGEKGLDIKGCPVCEASTRTDAVAAPERRFAMHVIRYSLKPGGFDIAEPFSVQDVGWAFGEKIYSTITDAALEWGDLKKHDLLLGPCEIKQFQRFDITVAGKAAWLESKETKALVAQTYKENQATDLTFMIGRKLTREQIEEDLAKVLKSHKQAFSMDAEPEEATKAEEALDLEAFLDEPAAVPAETAETTTTETPEAEKSDVLDFEDLLGDV